MRFKWLCFTLLIWAPIASAQQSPAPVLFFSDLTNGPATGNSDSTYTTNGGVYVTLYGNFLSPSPSATLNGATCLVIVGQPSTWLWYQRMVVQLTSTCSSGNFVVANAHGSSNGLPFTVTAGTIYYVSPTGNDSNAGTFQSPWATLPHTVQTIGLSPGNIAYVTSNVQQLADDHQWNGALTLRNEWCKASSTQPDALIGYPNSTGIQIGPSNGATKGLVTTDSSASGGGCAGNWVIAELLFRGVSATAINYGDNYRYIGNDVSNAGGAGDTTGYGTMRTTHFKSFGNYIHDMNVGDTSRLHQGTYFATDCNHTEHAWNLHVNSGGRAGLQIHSSPLSSGNGYILYDMSFHDNTFHDCREECILVDTFDPSQGPLTVYNNVVYNCSGDGSGDCIHMQLSGDFDKSHGLGSSPPPEYWYNNTVFASRNGRSCYGNSFPDVHTGITVTSFYQNNICFVPSGVTTPYWGVESYSGSFCGNSDTTSSCQTASGANNLVFGNGAPTFPSLFSSNINADPLFVKATVSGCPANCATDLHLSSASPAIGVALKTGPLPVYDHDGLIRPATPPVGAYEFSSGTVVVRPNPPTGLKAVVQ